MLNSNDDPTILAAQLRENLASNRLPQVFAKLYSQHTRLRANLPSLSSWREDEAVARLDDAVRLIEGAFIEREAGSQHWRESMRRAGELLEWLSYPELNPTELPLRLISAAAYQLAGYPARASGLLAENTLGETESQILRLLLKAEFQSLMAYLVQYWSGLLTTDDTKARVIKPVNGAIDNNQVFNEEEFSTSLQNWVVNETAGALGILCASLRWGDDFRLKKALDKLAALSKLVLHGNDNYSWLLAKLCAEVANTYIETSMRHYVTPLFNKVNENGKIAIERYLRQSYLANKALIWPSQAKGIEQLTTTSSFALCTPTGSGKTTIAELGIIQSLFLTSKEAYLETIQTDPETNKEIAPLALYLVPTRALAAEVEAKLSRVLRRLSNERVIVTGLYGGTDWGPTDAWLTAKDRTVLICTFEKAEALMRFLGPLFLDRLSLVIIDEAHAIQFDGDKNTLIKSDNRTLRLESLSMRLLSYLDEGHCRIIALSAVAAEIENILASWITGMEGATPAKTSYRSTRQLVGRLECLSGRGFEIRYDLMDNAKLQFDEYSSDYTPYIPNAFLRYPIAMGWEKKSSEDQLIPYLLWAAIQLAGIDKNRNQRTVLISITQDIGGYADDFLKLLDEIWVKEELPVFFTEPVESEKLTIWEKCLSSCEDYFGKNSREYRLLKKGIVIHHGKMPGLMARLLVELIEKQIVHLVIATSTLSEGVNLPFEVVLIPSIKRWNYFLSVREFGNLIGRAGRPGVSTEGRSLVLLDSRKILDKEQWKRTQKREKYFELINGLQQKNNKGVDEAIELSSKSPLAELIQLLEEEWKKLVNPSSEITFLEWLEKTVTFSPGDDQLVSNSDSNSHLEVLDTLDSILLSSIVEIEYLAKQEFTSDELEKKLQSLWRRSYAHFASKEEARLGEIFVKRGQALKKNIYPDTAQRRRLYRTSLPPRYAKQLINNYPRLKQLLAGGFDYSISSIDARFNYIESIVNSLASLSSFKMGERAGRKKVEWRQVLRWWLDPKSRGNTINPNDISDWHNYVSQNFGYRFNWGLGSLIGLIVDELHNSELRSLALEDWPQTGLPWIVFWLKELIVWGTLEPVATYLLSRGIKTTRQEAEEEAKNYYLEKSHIESSNELLNAVKIRDWVEARFISADNFLILDRPADEIKVKLLKNFSRAPVQLWRVLPIEHDNEITWFDPAGFPLALCAKPQNWKQEFVSNFDFQLDAEREVIFSSSYI